MHILEIPGFSYWQEPLPSKHVVKHDHVGDSISHPYHELMRESAMWSKDHDILATLTLVNALYRYTYGLKHLV